MTGTSFQAGMSELAATPGILPGAPAKPAGIPPLRGVSVAVFLANLVPYHRARWRAFAAGTGANVTVFENTARDGFRVLEVEDCAPEPYHRTSLFEHAEFASASRKSVQARVLAALDALRPRVVCVTGYAFPQSLAALQWSSRRGVPVVLCSESTRADASRNCFREWLKRAIVRLCSAALVGGIPHARYAAELGIAEHRVHLGYDVVENRHFEDGAQRARSDSANVRGRLALPSNYFFACSRFTPKKNLPFLISAYGKYVGRVAAESASKRVPGIWPLIIAGDGPLRPKLEAQVQGLGLQEKVRFPGAIHYHDLPAWYGLASAFVHASAVEQWGLVVNEAMAAGLPVFVSSKCGCAQDLIRETESGCRFDPTDEQGLSDLLFRASHGAFDLAAMGKRSQQLIGNWSPDRFARGMQAAIGAALEGPLPKSNGLQRVILALALRA